MQHNILFVGNTHTKIFQSCDITLATCSQIYKEKILYYTLKCCCNFEIVSKWEKTGNTKQKINLQIKTLD